MAWPDSIPVLGKQTQLKIWPEEKIAKFLEEDGLEGHAHSCYCSQNKIIAIEEGIRGQEFAESLIHEVVHNLFDVTGYDSFFSEDQEEAICVLMQNIYTPLRAAGIIKE